jgi:uncharacterized protein YegL
MSLLSFFVCLIGVLVGGARAAAGPAGCNAQVAIDANSFAALVAAIQQTPFSSNKEALVSGFCTNLTLGFTATQTVTLLNQFTFSSSKTNVVASITPYVLGLSSADLAGVLGAVTFSSDKLTVLAALVNLVTDLKANNGTVVAAFTFASDKAAAAALIAQAKPISCLWGSATVRQHVVFVLDVSGSMATPISGTQTRLQFATQQLLQVLAGLKASQFFNLVVFATNAVAWQPGVQPVTPQNLQAAANFLQKYSAAGSTNMLAALNLAISDPQAEAVVLASDGEPDCCAAQMFQIAKVWQSGSRVINTILIQAGGNPDPQAQSVLCGIAQAAAGFCRVNN